MGLIVAQPRPRSFEDPTQPALLHAGRPGLVIPRGRYGYVAIVKALPGELEAIKHVSVRSWRRLTPLVEVTAGRSRQPGQSLPLARSGLSGLPIRLAQCFGLEHTFFLDFPWLRSETQISLRRGNGVRTARAIPFVIDECESQSLSFIPVLHPGASDLAVQMAREIAAKGRGLGVRYAFSEVAWSTGHGMWDEILRLIERAKTDPELVDLVLDLGYIRPRPGFGTDDLLRALSSLPELRSWRSLALAGTSIPPSLAGIDDDSIGEVVRQEWVGWRALDARGPERMPAFADYGIQHPTRPARKMRGRPMRANLRYTSDDRFLMVRGRPLREVGIGQYRRLCAMLRSHAEFRGASYSWGDAEIAACATGATLQGGQRHWRAVGTSHHISHVTDDLESLERQSPRPR